MAVIILQHNILAGWININLHYFQAQENTYSQPIADKSTQENTGSRKQNKASSQS